MCNSFLTVYIKPDLGTTVFPVFGKYDINDTTSFRNWEFYYLEKHYEYICQQIPAIRVNMYEVFANVDRMIGFLIHCCWTESELGVEKYSRRGKTKSTCHPKTLMGFCYCGLWKIGFQICWGQTRSTLYNSNNVGSKELINWFVCPNISTKWELKNMHSLMYPSVFITPRIPGELHILRCFDYVVA